MRRHFAFLCFEHFEAAFAPKFSEPVKSTFICPIRHCVSIRDEPAKSKILTKSDAERLLWCCDVRNPRRRSFHIAGTMSRAALNLRKPRLLVCHTCERRISFLSRHLNRIPCIAQASNLSGFFSLANASLCVSRTCHMSRRCSFVHDLIDCEQAIGLLFEKAVLECDSMSSDPVFSSPSVLHAAKIHQFSLLCFCESSARIGE